jgi:hypothetical protein
MSENDNEKNIELLKLVKKAISHDNQLREKFAVGDKFRFVRERLNILAQNIEQDLANVATATKKIGRELGEGEVPVYVYLYNANGLILRSWLNMLTPKVFYEYSVNRPIYSEKSAIVGFLRLKPNKPQHAYLTIAMNPEDIISSPDINSVVKVKEGSLHFDKLLTFSHNDQDYVLTENGEFVPKP